jgi:hypothetical protein
MKTKLVFVAFTAFTVLLIACSNPDIEVTKAEFVESIIYSGGVSVVYKDNQIIKMTLDFNFQNLNTTEKEGTDAYKSEVYQILTKNAQLNIVDSLVKATYGYWPKEITKTSASELIMFYVIPNNTDLNKLVFQYDVSILGKTPGIFTYSDFGNMKPLSPKE